MKIKEDGLEDTSSRGNKILLLMISSICKIIESDISYCNFEEIFLKIRSNSLNNNIEEKIKHKLGVLLKKLIDFEKTHYDLVIDLDHKLLDPVSINKKCYLIMKAMNIINILKRDIDGSISYKYICDQLYLVITIFRQLEEIILLDN